MLVRRISAATRRSSTNSAYLRQSTFITTNLPWGAVRSRSLPPWLTQAMTFNRSHWTYGPDPDAPHEFPYTWFPRLHNTVIRQNGYYLMDDFYPMRLGELILDRYQVVALQWYDDYSTTWLARDLSFVSLKIFAKDMPSLNTSLNEVLHYMLMGPSLAESTHPGRKHIRRFRNMSTVTSRNGNHIFLILDPAQLSLTDVQGFMVKPSGRRGFHEDTAKAATRELLLAVDFLHTKAKIVHTGIHADSMFLGVDERSRELFQEVADTELANSVLRTVIPSKRSLYSSRLAQFDSDLVLLSDFTHAKSGDIQLGDAMRADYRAPEIVMNHYWGYAADIWSVGLVVWNLLGLKHPFTPLKNHAQVDETYYDASHLAEIIDLLGPPPLKVLFKNAGRSLEFWGIDGTWRGKSPLNPRSPIEYFARDHVKDPSEFARFLRRALTWDQEERATAKQLLEDPWLAPSSRESEPESCGEKRGEK